MKNDEYVKLQKIKLLKLWEILNRKTDKEHPLTTFQLIDELTDLGIKAERRTIYTDINTMIAWGYKVEKKRHNRDMYYWVEQRQFDLPELKIMMDAVKASKFIPEDKTEELLEKISDLGGSERGKLLRRNTVNFQVVKHSNEGIYSIVENIDKAIGRKCMITFLYFDLDRHGKRVYRHSNKIYKEQPLSMICDDGNYYLLCYTEDEGCDSNIKTFRLDRMENVTVTSEPITDAAVDALKSVKSYPKQVFKMYGGARRTVRLEFEPSLTGVIFNEFGENTRIAQNGGSYAASVSVQISPTFWGWLTQFAGRMRIVSPDDVAEKYRQWLHTAMDGYEQQVTV